MKNIEKQIEELNINRASALAPLEAESADRWERYMNCQDDTLIGGMSDQLNGERRSEINRRYDLFIEQVQNGGSLKSTSVVLALYDLEGNFVTDNIVNGAFGRCFCYDINGSTKFVGIAKRQSTYTKKGLKAVTRVRDYEYTFSGKSTKTGRFLYENIEILNESFNDSLEDDSSNSWIDYLYENK